MRIVLGIARCPDQQLDAQNNDSVSLHPATTERAHYGGGIKTDGGGYAERTSARWSQNLARVTSSSVARERAQAAALALVSSLAA